MNKAEREKLRIIFAEALMFSNYVKAQKLLHYVDALELFVQRVATHWDEKDLAAQARELLDYVDTLEAAQRFVVGCDCTVCKDNREALAQGTK